MPVWYGHPNARLRPPRRRTKKGDFVVEDDKSDLSAGNLDLSMVLAGGFMAGTTLGNRKEDGFASSVRVYPIWEDSNSSNWVLGMLPLTLNIF